MQTGCDPKTPAARRKLPDGHLKQESPGERRWPNTYNSKTKTKQIIKVHHHEMQEHRDGEADPKHTDGKGKSQTGQDRTAAAALQLLEDHRDKVFTVLKEKGHTHSSSLLAKLSLRCKVRIITFRYFVQHAGD